MFHILHRCQSPGPFMFHKMALLQTELQLDDLHVHIHTLLKQKADTDGKLERQQKEEVRLVQKAAHFKKIICQTNTISDYLPNRYGLLSHTPTTLSPYSSSGGIVTPSVNVTTPLAMFVTPTSNVTTPLSIVATSASNITTTVSVVATPDLMLTNAVASAKRKLDLHCEGSKQVPLNSSAPSGMPGCSGVSCPDVGMMEEQILCMLDDDDFGDMDNTESPEKCSKIDEDGNFVNDKPVDIPKGNPKQVEKMIKKEKSVDDKKVEIPKGNTAKVNKEKCNVDKVDNGDDKLKFQRAINQRFRK